MWIKRRQIYISLLERRKGKKKNNGNLKRLARRHQIRRPFSLSEQEIKIRLEVCDKKLNYFRKHGHRYWKKHLLQQSEIAMRKGRPEVER